MELPHIMASMAEVLAPYAKTIEETWVNPYVCVRKSDGT
jgi:hypothetical protein